MTNHPRGQTSQPHASDDNAGAYMLAALAGAMKDFTSALVDMKVSDDDHIRHHL